MTSNSTAQGQLRHFLTIEGLSRQIPDRDSRHRRILSHGGRTAGQEGAAAARQDRGQPVLRGQHPHPHHLRAGRQAAVGRRAHPQHRPSATSKGESLLDTLRKLEAMQCDMFVVRHADSGAAHFIARHVTPARGRDQCRRRPPRPSDAGDARHVHHPPPQAGLRPAEGRHRRRRPALARGPLADPRPQHRSAPAKFGWSPRAPCCRPTWKNWACECSTIRAKVCATSM
jgi:hypothetical protein